MPLVPIAGKLARRLIYSFGFFALTFVGANLVVENVAESALAGGAQSAFGLPAKPDVEINGFPILVRLFAREVPSVDVTAADVPLGDDELRARTVSIRLETVRVSDFFGGENLSFSIARGRVAAEVTDAALTDLLRRSGEELRVGFRPGRTTVRASPRIGGRERDVRARGRLRLSRGAVVFEPDRVTVDGEEPPSELRSRARREVAFRVPLPPLPGDGRISDIETLEGFARLTADLGALRFPS